jgi:hypothetical protein
MGAVAVEDEDSFEDEDARHSRLRAVIAAIATNTPPARILRIRIRWVVARAGLLRVTPPLKAARCCQHVCGFRYADDMRQLVACERARADR